MPATSTRQSGPTTITRRQAIAMGGTIAAWAATPLGARSAPSECSSQPIYYDSDGLIVHENLDGGDTAQREGWYWLGVWIRQNVLKEPWLIPRRLTFPEVISLLEPNKDGVFFRHPKLTPWNNPYSKQFGFSRDQLVPMVAAMGVWNLFDPIHRLWNALPQDVVGGTKHSFNGDWVKVFGQKTVYTGDIISPATVNLFKRAWNEKPNDQFGEEELLGNSKLKIPPAENNRDDVGNDLNHIVMLLMSIIRYSTDISASATTLYAKDRLFSYGSFLSAYRSAYDVSIECVPFTPDARAKFDAGIANGWKSDASRIYGTVRWYHRKGAGANPMLAELYAPIVHAYFE
jgi:hypothetical protein